MKLRLGNFIREHLRELARVCIDLAREELAVFLRRLAREVRPLRGPAISVAAGLLLAFFSLAALTAALILGLAQFMPAWGAALTASAVLGLGAALFLRRIRDPAWAAVRVLAPDSDDDGDSGRPRGEPPI